MSNLTFLGNVNKDIPVNVDMESNQMFCFRHIFQINNVSGVRFGLKLNVEFPRQVMNFPQKVNVSFEKR